MMHLGYLGVAKNHVPSCLKLLRRSGFHYEAGESEDKFLKRVSLEMRQDCKQHKYLILQDWIRFFLATFCTGDVK